MNESYPHEDTHVGRLLAGHREALGLTVEQVGAELGKRGTSQCFNIEHNREPSYAEVEHHHQGVLEAFVHAGIPKPVSLARREQWWATTADMALWQLAAEGNPPVQWWWGTRSQTGERGAWCNLCQDLIHGYDAGRGMTRRARMGVMEHRISHINALSITPTPLVKEVQP